MAKPKQKKPETVKLKAPVDPAVLARRRRVIVQGLAILFLLVGGAAGFAYLRQVFDQRVTKLDGPPSIMLKDRPVWMSDFLAEQIMLLAAPTDVHSVFDRQLLVDTADLLRASPWVKTVKSVRRVYNEKPGDAILVDCEFRTPVALVHWENYYWLVDAQGVKLPEQYTAEQAPKVIRGRAGKIEIRVIEGVQQPPVESGNQWPGDDLAAGLALAKTLYGQPWGEEIIRVNVANFGGRVDVKEAHLTLITKYNTEIRWGRPLDAKDFFAEVATATKLKYLEDVKRQFGRVDANRPWIDIRFDKITYPSASADADGRSMP